MTVIISNDVLKSLSDYKKSLINYPISRQRALEKYNKMVDSLQNLGNYHSQCRPCVHKKLGQEFDSDGIPLFKDLYRFNYKDESNFQWAFAIIIDEQNDTITITKMMPSIFVTEKCTTPNNRKVYH